MLFRLAWPFSPFRRRNKPRLDGALEEGELREEGEISDEENNDQPTPPEVSVLPGIGEGVEVWRRALKSTVKEDVQKTTSLFWWFLAHLE